MFISYKNIDNYHSYWYNYDIKIKNIQGGHTIEKEELEKLREKILNEEGPINYDEWLKLCGKDRKVQSLIASIQEISRKLRASMFAIKKIKTKIQKIDVEFDLTKKQAEEADKKIDLILQSLEPIKQNSIEAKEIIIDPKKC